MRDNEFPGNKLIYEKIVRTSPPKSSRNGPFVIDVSQLTSGSYGYNHPNSAWESYYGASNFVSELNPGRAKSSKFLDSYKSVFTSPYFDYRKTHSKVRLPRVRNTYNNWCYKRFFGGNIWKFRFPSKWNNRRGQFKKNKEFWRIVLLKNGILFTLLCICDLSSIWVW